jgi:hypothetical protein
MQYFVGQQMHKPTDLVKLIAFSDEDPSLDRTEEVATLEQLVTFWKSRHGDLFMAGREPAPAAPPPAPTPFYLHVPPGATITIQKPKE